MRLQIPIALNPYKISRRRGRRTSEDAHDWPSLHHLNLHPFPLDVWLEILALLPASSTRAVTLTCKSMGWLAQPRMFQHISFSPICPRAKHSQYLEHLTRRINFLTSPRISRGIEDCTITFAKEQRFTDIEVGSALEILILALPSFPNLRRLTIHSASLTIDYLGVIARLPLQSLELQSCTLPPNVDIDSEDSPLTPKLGMVTCNTERRQAPTTASLLSWTLTPSHLRHLTVGPTNAEAALHALATSPTPFARLTTLELPVESFTSPHILPALSNCPATSHLSLRYYEIAPKTHLKDLPPTLLPNLTSFDGPHRYAALLAQGRALHTLTLRAFDNLASVCDPVHLCNMTLMHLSHAAGAHVRVLDITAVYTLTPTLLSSIFASFPNLTSLALNAHPRFFPRCLGPTDVVSAFRSLVRGGVAVPVRLESVKFGVETGQDRDRRRVERVVSGIVEVMRTVCPLLREARVWYWRDPGPQWVGWSADGNRGAGKGLATWEGKKCVGGLRTTCEDEEDGDGVMMMAGGNGGGGLKGDGTGWLGKALTKRRSRN